MRLSVLWAAAAVVIAHTFIVLALGPTASAQTPADEGVLDIAKRARNALDDGRTAEASRLVRSVSEAPSFSGLSPRARHDIQEALAKVQAREPGCASVITLTFSSGGSFGCGTLWKMSLLIIKLAKSLK